MIILSNDNLSKKGEKTYGKGTVQEIQTLQDGDKYKLTTKNGLVLECADEHLVFDENMNLQGKMEPLLQHHLGNH